MLPAQIVTLRLATYEEIRLRKQTDTICDNQLRHCLSYRLLSEFDKVKRRFAEVTCARSSTHASAIL